MPCTTTLPPTTTGPASSGTRTVGDQVGERLGGGHDDRRGPPGRPAPRTPAGRARPARPAGGRTPRRRPGGWPTVRPAALSGSMLPVPDAEGRQDERRERGRAGLAVERGHDGPDDLPADPEAAARVAEQPAAAADHPDQLAVDDAGRDRAGAGDQGVAVRRRRPRAEQRQQVVVEHDAPHPVRGEACGHLRAEGVGLLAGHRHDGHLRRTGRGEGGRGRAGDRLGGRADARRRRVAGGPPAVAEDVAGGVTATARVLVPPASRASNVIGRPPAGACPRFCRAPRRRVASLGAHRRARPGPPSRLGAPAGRLVRAAARPRRRRSSRLGGRRPTAARSRHRARPAGGRPAGRSGWSRTPGLAEEAYRLRVTAEGITLTAATPQGLNWAVQTLRQLLPPSVLLPAPTGEELRVPLRGGGGRAAVRLARRDARRGPALLRPARPVPGRRPAGPAQAQRAPPAPHRGPGLALPRARPAPAAPRSAAGATRRAGRTTPRATAPRTAAPTRPPSSAPSSRTRTSAGSRSSPRSTCPGTRWRCWRPTRSWGTSRAGRTGPPRRSGSSTRC